MKRIIIALLFAFIAIPCFATHNFTFINESDEDIQVTIHYKGSFWSSLFSYPSFIKPIPAHGKEIIDMEPLGRPVFISLKTLTGTFANLGARLDLMPISTHFGGEIFLKIGRNGLPTAYTKNVEVNGPHLIKISHPDADYKKAQTLMLKSPQASVKKKITITNSTDYPITITYHFITGPFSINLQAHASKTINGSSLTAIDMLINEASLKKNKGTLVISDDKDHEKILMLYASIVDTLPVLSFENLNNNNDNDHKKLLDRRNKIMHYNGSLYSFQELALLAATESIMEGFVKEFKTPTPAKRSDAPGMTRPQPRSKRDQDYAEWERQRRNRDLLFEAAVGVGGALWDLGTMGGGKMNSR